MINKIAILFLAYWIGTNAAVVNWEQQTRSCLYHETAGGTQTFVGCYDGTGRVTVEFGKVGPLSGDLRPRKGDWYVVQIDGVVYRTPLVGRPIRLALMLR
jgi:hypothetical protein